MGKITDLELKKILRDGKEKATAENKQVTKGLGSGLLLVIQKKTGKADFYCREPYQKLGSAEKLTLKNAYAKVQELKPKEKTRAERSNSPILREFLTSWLEEQFKKGEMRDQWYMNNKSLVRFLDKCKLLSVRLDKINRKLVYDKISLLNTDNEQAHNAYASFQLLERCLYDAELRGVIEVNPLTKNPFKRPKYEHRKSVGYTNLKTEFFEPLSNPIIPYYIKYFFLLIALSGRRFTEVRELQWSEIDFDKKLIILPPERHKTGHRTGLTQIDPISDIIIKLLLLVKQDLENEGITSKYVFATRDKRFNGAIGENTIRPYMKLTNGNHDLHGFRSCAQTYVKDQGIDTETAELLLAHDTRTDTMKAYDRELGDERLQKIRKASDLWCRYLIRNQLTAPYLTILRLANVDVDNLE